MTEVIRSKPTNSEEIAERKPPLENMTWIPGGTFHVGSEDFYPEERPVHEVTGDGFWMDRYTVTNEQFARFVETTGYVTLAERPLNPTDFPSAPPSSRRIKAMIQRSRSSKFRARSLKAARICVLSTTACVIVRQRASRR